MIAACALLRCDSCEPQAPVDAGAEARPTEVAVRAESVVLRLGGPSPFWMFRAGPHHRGQVEVSAPRRRPRLLWKVETEGAIWAQPVIGHDGTIYVGSFDGSFSAISPSGARRWSVELGDKIYSTALLARRGRIYVGSDDDHFFCLSRTGRVRWRLATSEVARPTSAFDADTSPAPAPDDGVYFAAGPHLWAVDGDGTVRWRYEAGDKIFSSPAVAEDGTVWFGAQDGRLYGLTPEGEPEHRITVGHDIDASPVVTPSGGLIVGADNGRVVALAADGTERWRTDVGGHVRASPAVAADGTVYVSTFGPSVQIVALDGETGAERWTASLGRADRPRDYGSHSSPVVDASGMILAGAPDGHLVALSASGQRLWRFRTGGWIESSPALGGDGTIYVGSDDSALYALGR